MLCFGGAKNGLPIGEAVVFFNKELAHEFDYRCKQAGQLASKMRFLAAPLGGLLESGAWLTNAQNANRCAGCWKRNSGAMGELAFLSRPKQIPYSSNCRGRWRIRYAQKAGVFTPSLAKGARDLCVPGAPRQPT